MTESIAATCVLGPLRLAQTCSPPLYYHFKDLLLHVRSHGLIPTWRATRLGVAGNGVALEVTEAEQLLATVYLKHDPVRAGSARELSVPELESCMFSILQVHVAIPINT